MWYEVTLGINHGDFEFFHMPPLTTLMNNGWSINYWMPCPLLDTDTHRVTGIVAENEDEIGEFLEIAVAQLAENPITKYKKEIVVKRIQNSMVVKEDGHYKIIDRHNGAENHFLRIKIKPLFDAEQLFGIDTPFTNEKMIKIFGSAYSTGRGDVLDERAVNETAKKHDLKIDYCRSLLEKISEILPERAS